MFFDVQKLALNAQKTALNVQKSTVICMDSEHPIHAKARAFPGFFAANPFFVRGKFFESENARFRAR
jgi:hypothetical protein